MFSHSRRDKYVDVDLFMFVSSASRVIDGLPTAEEANM